MSKKTIYDKRTARTDYLNNTGSRAVSIDRNGNRERLPVSFDGGVTIKDRAVLYWEQCGNFGFPCIRIKGKAVFVYPDSEVEPTYWTTYELKYPPFYQHDCPNCNFLGRYKRSDLYHCNKGNAGVDTIVARHSEKCGDYTSGLILDGVDPLITEGARRARAKGLLKEKGE